MAHLAEVGFMGFAGLMTDTCKKQGSERKSTALVRVG